MAAVIATSMPNEWPVYNVMEGALKARVKGCLLHPLLDQDLSEWIVPPVNVREPNPPPSYVVSFLAFHDRGLRTSAS